MKNFTLSIFALFLSCISIAQVNQGEISFENEGLNLYMQKEKAPTIYGKILNPTSDATEVTYTYVLPFRESQSTNVLYANPDGTFEINFDHAYPYQQIWIGIDTFFWTGAMVQSDLTIEVDAKYLLENGGGSYKGKGIKYSGTDGPLNDYLMTNLLYKREEKLNLHRKINKIQRDRKMPYEKFKTSYDSLYAEFFALDKAFVLENPSTYSWIIHNETKSDYLSNIITKHWGKKEMDKETLKMVNEHQGYLLSNASTSFYGYLTTYYKIRISSSAKKEWDVFRSYSKNTTQDQIMIDSLLHYEGLKERGEAYDKKAFRKLNRKVYSHLKDTITEINMKATIALLDKEFDPMKADLLKLNLGVKDLKMQKKIFDLVFESMETGCYKNVLEREYNQTIGKINKVNETLNQSKKLTGNSSIGTPIAEMPFEAKMYHLKSGNADDFLKSIKNTFEGKALLLDFWATWCGPCISQMPHSKKLHEKTHDLPVEFIYLCTSSNSDLDKWKSKVIEMEQPGIHIFVDQAIAGELMSKFSLSGYPSYALINKDGVYKPGIEWMSKTTKKELEKMIGE